MTFHTHFHCFICGGGVIGKENLTMFNGHLTCGTCIAKQPKRPESEYFKVTYRTARKSPPALIIRKGYGIDTEEQARAYTIAKKRAVEIIQVEVVDTF